MEMHRFMYEEQDFEQAYQIFEFGANADPYAKLQLEEPLARDMDLVTLNHGRPLVAVGLNNEQPTPQPVVLYISATVSKNSQTLFVMYNDTDDDGLGLRPSCRVRRPGQATTTTTTNTEGCLASSGGLVIAEYGAVNYHYDIDKDNKFWSSLYGFSEHEAERMFHCKDKCPYPEYEKFYQYYGQMDYGAVWLKAALKGQSTADGDLKFQHGQEDFSKLAEPGRMAAVETAAVTMSVRTHINRIMTEWAVDVCWKQECQVDGTSCPTVAEAWDQAVSLFVGSLVQPDETQPGGYESGHLYYGMADELCQDFATCGPNGNDIEGTSAVNLVVIQLFQTGRLLLEKGACSTAELTYGQIIHLMTVPLIQGTLRSAYRLQYTHKGDPKEQGRGVAYMASLLPDLYSCSPQDADKVYNELSILSTAKKAPDFGIIKEAIERNYRCMMVTCEDVGGLYDDAHDRYRDGASPCGSRRARQRSGHRKKRGSSSGQHGLSGFLGTLGQVFVMGTVFVAVVFLAFQRREQWGPALSSRADILLSRVWGARPVRYHEVRTHSLQLRSQGSDLSESYRSYGVEDDIDDFALSNRNSNNLGDDDGADNSQSSTDYRDIEDELL